MAVETPKQWRQKRWPLLGNGQQTHFRGNIHVKPQWRTARTVFFIRSAPGHIGRSSSQLRVTVEKVKTSAATGYVRDSRQPVSTWAEENIVGIRYQSTTSEDTDNLVRAIIGSENCELARSLWLRVVMIYKCPINPIANPNSVSSH
jgi:hypothetical protein